jgi:hypothetical protein
LHGRDIDRHAHRLRLSRGELARLAQHESADRVDQPGFLGQGMNTAGLIAPRCGWVQRASAS